ncbi:M16 family metallopeptidase [Sorangium sp. So ce204]|uniref:M16 family metallopeptidase n=1 Tax=Sorangium sp. So ce204 TaxID=3133288 RepID=UPI003F600461
MNERSERRDLRGRRTARPWLSWTSALAAAAVACGCAAGRAPQPPAQAGAPATPAPATSAPAAPPAEAARGEQPPPSGPAKPARMPAIAWAELPSGLRVATAVSRALPLVEVRVVIRGGSAADGERTGLAAITGELLLRGGAGGLPGRELLARVESLGASLRVDTGLDATVIALRAPSDRLAEAALLLGHVVQRPRLDAAELARLKAQAAEAARERARSDARWGALMVLFRDLYALPTELHPYASFGATAAELPRITAADCRAFHAAWYVPKNTVVVVAGDTTPEAARAAVEKAFTDRRGAEPPALSFTDPVPPASLKITIVDRPKSAESELFLGVLGPERGASEWPALAVAGEVLGGPSGRLSQELLEPRGPAREVSAAPLDVAHGPVPLLAHVRVPAARTGLAAQAMLEHAEQLAAAAPSQEEVDAAARRLTARLGLGLGTATGLADEIAVMQALDLPDDHHESYRKELRDITPAFAGKVAHDNVRPAHAAIVVVGDAQAIGPMLSRLGDVKVVDPTRAFERKRTIPRDASASPAPAPGAGRAAPAEEPQ